MAKSRGTAVALLRLDYSFYVKVTPFGFFSTLDKTILGRCFTTKKIAK